ncbi:hypothetical protein ABZY58_11105 [Micromonospora tulbaghiae]|uniref:hypothetical protein n=1 Tax=Micromonospora tulbaghiae TaxID=479978 RepID=UPI0033AE0562
MPDTTDQRRWWLVAASSIARTHLYEAPNRRSAIAAFRRDLRDAEHGNGRSHRETNLWLRAQTFTAQGPLTTEQAFTIDFGWALTSAVDRWAAIEHGSNACATADDARRRGLSDDTIERIRRQVASRYTPEPAR